MIRQERVITFLVLGLMIVSGGRAFAQPNKPFACLAKIGQKEWAILWKDIDGTKKKSLLENDEARNLQIENLRQLLAFSCEAVKLGLAADKTAAAELGFIRSETLAVDYDKRLSKGVDPYVPFTRITEAQIAKFYTVAGRDAEFDRFLVTKMDLLRGNHPELGEKEVGEDERKQAKDFFARIKISENSALLLGEPFRSESEFRARLQQSQFLSRLVAEHLSRDASVSDEDIKKYIDAHPEFDSSTKKATAVKILERAKAGEDFAALADEFSDDPGNTGADGKKNGGLYKDVPIGMFVPQFEKASLALEPGQISSTLVVSDYGFHVIKLEKKSPDGSKYDVRHILIGTGVKDPDDPDAKEVPAAVLVRSKLETEREAKLIGEIVARNPIVIEDYKPPVTTAPRKRVVKKKR